MSWSGHRLDETREINTKWLTSTIHIEIQSGHRETLFTEFLIIREKTIPKVTDSIVFTVKSECRVTLKFNLDTPADYSDEEEAVSTTAPIFNYNPVVQNKQRRLPTIRGVEHGLPVDSQSSEYPSPQTTIRAVPFGGIHHRPYAPPSPSPRSTTERSSYVEHPVFNLGKSGYEPPVNSSSTRELNYSTHSLPPVSLTYKRTVGPSVVRMPPTMVSSIYDQHNTPNSDISGPRSIVIQSQAGNVPLDSDSEDDVRYAIV